MPFWRSSKYLITIFSLRTISKADRCQAHRSGDCSCITVLGCSLIPVPLTSVKWVWCALPLQRSKWGNNDSYCSEKWKWPPRPKPKLLVNLTESLQSVVGGVLMCPSSVWAARPIDGAVPRAVALTSAGSLLSTSFVFAAFWIQEYVLVQNLHSRLDRLGFETFAYL